MRYNEQIHTFKHKRAGNQTKNTNSVHIELEKNPAIFDKLLEVDFQNLVGIFPATPSPPSKRCQSLP